MAHRVLSAANSPSWLIPSICRQKCYQSVISCKLKFHWAVGFLGSQAALAGAAPGAVTLLGKSKVAAWNTQGRSAFPIPVFVVLICVTAEEPSVKGKSKPRGQAAVAAAELGQCRGSEKEALGKNESRISSSQSPPSSGWKGCSSPALGSARSSVPGRGCPPCVAPSRHPPGSFGPVWAQHPGEMIQGSTPCVQQGHGDPGLGNIHG